MNIPLSLYIHIPWCVQKCPYCDFNSHTLRSVKGELPEKEYVARVLADLDDDIARFGEARPLTSIFIGGGTPSLFSGAAITALLDGVRARLSVTENTEITLEANPGTVDESHFDDYHCAGVNRISIGVQSFDAKQLKRLGRIHNPDDAVRAVAIAKQAGFDNINIDIMFGLPQQTAEQALLDIEQGIALNTEHLSYYQLTLEPNTPFAHRPPPLPDEEHIDTRFDVATERLHAAGFRRYEVSAWSRGRQAQHNLNYWQHGDYLGIGAGAHGKITTMTDKGATIIRTTKPRAPTQYLNTEKHQALQIVAAFRDERRVSNEEKPFEFMLNAMRLMNGFERRLLADHGLFDEQQAMPILQAFVDKGLLVIDQQRIAPTDLGKRFVNDMVSAFL